VASLAHPCVFIFVENPRVAEFDPSPPEGSFGEVSRPGASKGRKLAGDLHAALGVAVDDHTQGAIEIVVFLGTQVVEFLEGEGLVTGEQSVPVTESGIARANALSPLPPSPIVPGA
jgi:hypothetical protein